MTETKKLRLAQQKIISGEREAAKKMLLELYSSKRAEIKLGVILALITVVDPVHENKELVRLAEEGIKIAQDLRAVKEHSYLLSRKAHFLMSEASTINYRRRNLMLASGVFDWVEFTLEKDKEEYRELGDRLQEISREIQGIEAGVLAISDLSKDHRFRGNIFMSLGEFYAVKYFTDRMGLASGGRIPSMIANTYFVRRWNLDRFIILNHETRRVVQTSVDRCYEYFEKAIAEFEKGKHRSELAHAYYNFAVNLRSLSNKFRKARWCLQRARTFVDSVQEVLLARQITDLETAVADKNKNIRDYVSEFGLDMPNPSFFGKEA